MAQRTVDLRSDTTTRPTDEMREAMKEAEVGDDAFGEDPTVNRLQDLAAEKLGMEAALLLPTGSMANGLALLLHTKPGDTFFCHERAHVMGRQPFASSLRLNCLITSLALPAPLRSPGIIATPP